MKIVVAHAPAGSVALTKGFVIDRYNRHRSDLVNVMKIETVGVVGAGVMGRGLAETLAASGFRVLLVDLTDAILSEAIDRIGYSLKSASLFDRGLRENLSEVRDRVDASTDYAVLSDADFIIENATESRDVKRDIYARFSGVCRDGCVIAANTSVIPIEKLASQYRDPAAVLGMHFMNPVPKKPVVEVIRSKFTSDETVATACSLLERIGKRAIIVNDRPGFVTNRVLMLTINEAIAVVEDGVASPASVDDIFVSCFSHAMGPLATADLIGLDTILYSLNELHEHCGDEKFVAREMLRDMVAKGDLGRKTGRGFFDYSVHGSAR